MASQVQSRFSMSKGCRSAFMGLLLVACLGLFTASMPGCARQEGTAVQPVDLARIREGVSTMGDVKRILGKPDEVKTVLGNQTWVYLHSKRSGWFMSNTRVRQVSILFSTRGIVRKITVVKHVHHVLF
jgi:outer membrane protein assembly factor BamE (lipoprotein component of BamABCDE complex)